MAIDREKIRCEHSTDGKRCFSSKECAVCCHCYSHCPQHTMLKSSIVTKFSPRDEATSEAR